MSNSAILYIRPLGFPWETQDPFLFCVYHNDDFPAGNGQMGPAASLAGRPLGHDFTIKDGWRMYHGKRVPGFPSHPHCGFETVTIVNKGLVDHSDSLGAAGRFGFGDVQWMTAGKGVQHCEMFPLLNQSKGNPLELFQIWLNLPAKSKLVEPHFSMLWAEDIPLVKSVDANGKATEVKVVAGELAGHRALASPPDSWASDPGNQVAIWIISMEAESSWTLPAATAGTNRSLYFFEGEQMHIEGQRIGLQHAVGLEPTAQLSLKNGAKPGKLLLLQGKPMNEPVAQYGPFVMNTQAQIREVMAEFQRTEFGGWPWGSTEFVHPKERARFALHADGREEIKPLPVEIA